MERIEILIKVAEKFFLEKFPENIQYLQKKVQGKQYKEIIKNQYVKMREKAEEKSIVYFGLSFLYSSLYDKSYEIVFTMLNKNFYLDANPIENFVKLPVFFELYEENMKYAMSQLIKEKGNIQPYEENEVRKVCAFYYYAAIYELFRSLSWDQYFRNENLIFFCGMYHGEAIQWTVSKENMDNSFEK